jgi:hypothetical protein
MMVHGHKDPRAQHFSADDSKSSQQQEAEAQAAEQLHQQLLEAAAAWPRYKQQQATGVAAACSNIGSTTHTADQSQQDVDAAALAGADEAQQQQQQQHQHQQEELSAAAGLLSFLQAQLAGSSSALANGTANGSTAVEPKHAVPGARQVQLPGQVAAALTAGIWSSSDSGSSCADGVLSSLRCCLASMAAAALQQLQERGHR